MGEIIHKSILKRIDLLVGFHDSIKILAAWLEDIEKTGDVNKEKAIRTAINHLEIRKKELLKNYTPEFIEENCFDS